MAIETLELVRDEGGFVVRAHTGGRPQDFHCPSENSARALLARLTRAGRAERERTPRQLASGR